MSLAHSSSVDSPRLNAIDEACVWLSRARPREALSAIARALAEDPHDARALLVAATAHLALNDFASAERDALAARALAPESVPVWIVHADVLGAMERYIEALEALDTALKLDPNDAEIHLRRGWCLYRQTRGREALACVGQVLRLDPSSAGARTLRAAVLNRGAWDLEADEEALAALQLDPSSIEAHVLRGTSALHRGALAEAENHLREALRQDPLEPMALEAMLVLRKRQHPIVRHWKPGWRGPRDTGLAEPIFGPPAPVPIRVPALLMAACALLLPWPVAHRLQEQTEWSAWLAWPAAIVAGALAGFAVFCAYFFLREFVRGMPGAVLQVLSMLHTFTLEPLGDLIVTVRRENRHLVPPGRMRSSIALTAFWIVAAGLAVWSWRDGDGLWLRAVGASAILLPVCFGRWQGDARQLAVSGAPAAAAWLAALLLASTTFAWIGLMLALAGFLHFAELTRERKARHLVPLGLGSALSLALAAIEPLGGASWSTESLWAAGATLFVGLVLACSGGGSQMHAPSES